VVCFHRSSRESFQVQNLCCSALPIAGTMASADFCRCSCTLLCRLLFDQPTNRSPRVRTITFLPFTRCIYWIGFGQYRTLFCFANSSALRQPLVCSSCSSSRDFALSFFQIPPRDGHPCCWLIVPIAWPIVDFHHPVIVHAEHTKKVEVISHLYLNITLNLQQSILSNH
jgi:hypothetical protein